MRFICNLSQSRIALLHGRTTGIAGRDVTIFPGAVSDQLVDRLVLLHRRGQIVKTRR